MPWRGPGYPGEFPTLGWLVGEWIEAWCVIPDGDHRGEPYRLTDEMWTFLARHYRLRPDAQPGQRAPAFVYRRSQLVRPQKWGKGPFTCAIACAEGVGPVLFDGWDAAGEPIGRPWPTPLIQITATSTDQTDNVFRPLQSMIDFGPLADLIPDTGETRINLPGRGRIDPVSSSARSRLGQPVTFVLHDESGIYTPSTGMLAVAATQRRGLAGMSGRSIETTNAWDPSEGSQAQLTAESQRPDIYRDHRLAPEGLRYSVRAERRRIHRHVYGDSWWVDLDAIEGEAAELLEHDPAQAERFFGNRVVTGRSSWMDMERWQACAHAGLRPAAGDRISLGFDGSSGTERQDYLADSTALIGCRLSDGLLFPLGLWEAPGKGPWRPPLSGVVAAVRAAFRRYDVVRMYADPPGFQTQITDWQAEFGAERVVEWWTNRDTPMAAALERVQTDVTTGALVHDDDQRLATHVRNAVTLTKQASTDTDARRVRTLIRKRSEAEKIDAAMAATLA